MEVAAWFCNKLIVLKNGEIVESGNATQIIDTPKHPYTRILLGELNN